MSTTSEIVERLKALVYRDVPWSHSYAVTTMSEAAEKIAELERENARMRAALEPFVEKARDYRHEDPAHHGIVLISDLRRAAALAGSGEK
jgi:hypothetical protein